jgi:hypothetical protein
MVEDLKSPMTIQHTLPHSDFYDVYINKHEGKHMTGDHIRILLLSMPFLLLDLIIEQEVCK